MTSYEPRPEVQGVPHITGISHVGGWSLAFDFAYIPPLAHEYLAAATEFVSAAVSALKDGHIRAFADNAYSSTELLAKTEMLCAQPTLPRMLNTKSHGIVTSTYNQWARLENTDASYAALLNRLSSMRNPARYLRGELGVEVAEANEMLDTLEEMHRNVEAIVQGDDERETNFNLIAAREIRAGELITNADFRLTPR